MLFDVAHGQVIAVPLCGGLLGAVPGCQCPTVMAKDDAFEQEWCCRPCSIAARTSIGVQNGMHAVPTTLVDDWQVFGFVPLLLVAKFAEVGSVAQKLVDQTLVNRLSLTNLAILGGPCF